MVFFFQIPYTYISEKAGGVSGIFSSHRGGTMNGIRDGDIYKVLRLHTHTIEIRYGYYDECERGRGDPIPIYPDFKLHPLYTIDGYPLVTQMQTVCPYGTSPFEDGFCVECEFFHHCEDLIGICKNKKNRKTETNK